MGTAISSIGLRRNYPDHPHARGDSSFRECPSIRLRGSPPRPWGQPIVLCQIGRDNRITPTPVGTAVRRRASSLITSDHPHARGDSDLIWVQNLYRRRITPTPVGTAIRKNRLTELTADHPHARGDSNRKTSNVKVLIGSPPRPWGQPAVGPLTVSRPRITPTPVGTAPRASSSSACSTDHPHARGDSAGSVQPTALLPGSPPRPWGQRAICFRFSNSQRITPTPVGTARALKLNTASCPDHPHARGDSVVCRGDPDRYHGSPPRPWGQRKQG